jgi:hypothetical protein
MAGQAEGAAMEQVAARQAEAVLERLAAARPSAR